MCFPAVNNDLHCKFLPHENYWDWELRGPCRKNLHYIWRRAVRIAWKPHDDYRSYNYHGVSLQFLQPFSIDSADFPCRDPAISSPRSFYGQNICSVPSGTVMNIVYCVTSLGSKVEDIISHYFPTDKGVGIQFSLMGQ